MTAARARARTWSPKANKFSAIKTTVDGIRFDSKREAERYQELVLLQRGGVISDLELQPAFKLEIDGRPVLIRSDGYPNGRQVTYRADFAYTVVATGERCTEDSKGFPTPEYKLKRAVVEAMHPGLRIVEV